MLTLVIWYTIVPPILCKSHDFPSWIWGMPTLFQRIRNHSHEELIQCMPPQSDDRVPYHYIWSNIWMCIYTVLQAQLATNLMETYRTVSTQLAIGTHLNQYSNLDNT